MNPDPARVSKKLLNSEKTTLEKMDVNDHDIMVAAFREIDVVINTAGPFYKTAVPVAKAAVEAKVNYIDICDDYEGTEILFNSEIDSLARDAGITVLTGMGSDPGTNNVLVKWYADRLDAVDDVYLYWVVSIAELAGADGITVHLREDRRHIQDRDVMILRSRKSLKWSRMSRAWRSTSPKSFL